MPIYDPSQKVNKALTSKMGEPGSEHFYMKRNFMQTSVRDLNTRKYLLV